MRQDVGEKWTWTRAPLIQRGSGYWSIFEVEALGQTRGGTLPTLYQRGEGFLLEFDFATSSALRYEALTSLQRLLKF